MLLHHLCKVQQNFLYMMKLIRLPYMCRQIELLCPLGSLLELKTQMNS